MHKIKLDFLYPIVPDPSTGNETSYDNETIFDIYDATNCPIVIPEEKSLIENRLRLLMYICKISLTFLYSYEILITNGY